MSRACEANAVVADAALDPVPDNADSAGSNSERTSEFEIPMRFARPLASELWMHYSVSRIGLRGLIHTFF
jgi:hypothetical protein